MNLDLITTNVYSKHLSNRLLICGTCLVSEWPEHVETLNDGRTLLTVCLESVHFNTAFGKIVSILAKGAIEEIVVLTKDGSPHCRQLPDVVDWALKVTKSESVVDKYFVIEHGTLLEIPKERIKEKRHLSK